MPWSVFVNVVWHIFPETPQMLCFLGKFVLLSSKLQKSSNCVAFTLYNLGTSYHILCTLFSPNYHSHRPQFLWAYASNCSHFETDSSKTLPQCILQWNTPSLPLNFQVEMLTPITYEFSIQNILAAAPNNCAVRFNTLGTVGKSMQLQLNTH
jgi:hypothetical protein